MRARTPWQPGEIDADVHTLLATIPLWIGVDLLRPESTFATSQAWSAFARIAGETVWGAAFLLIGAIGWLGMLTGRRRLKLASLSVLTASHLMTACILAIGSPIGTGSGTYALIAILAYRFIRHIARKPCRR